MSKVDLLDLFRRCPHGSVLFEVAQEAARRVDASKAIRIVVSEPRACETILGIYTRRLAAIHDRHEQVPGLKETVQTLTSATGQVRGGYAETGNGLIYFFTDEAGRLIGCVL